VTLRRRLDRAAERAQALGTDDASRREAWYRAHPEAAAGARRKLAAMIEQTTAAAEAGDQVAVYRLGAIAATLASAVRDRAEPDDQLAQELEALAAYYHDLADLPDKDVRDTWGQGAP
jgi:hypothetical protein